MFLVLNESVAKALESQNRPYTIATRKFIQLMDMFFDCLNVSSLYKGQKIRKEALLLYYDVLDWRFQVTRVIMAILNKTVYYWL